ncbi:MAG TPA: peptidoglycan-binding protein [Candidatus Paceibacterota bacterium]|nr:peptidoglycan-binding protein [Candidatus Paceibacterota bacterium]
MITNTKKITAQAMTLSLMAAMLLTGASVSQAQQMYAQTTTAASITFTRDLTIGSVGADVIALQNLLISGGFTIPAGATGYFGTQTQAALARYQAAYGIAPAAGYFGPITRGHIHANVTPTTPTTPTNPGTNDELRGDEARLMNFELRREASSGNEGEEEVEIATAEFDVERGDVRVERMDLRVIGTDTDLNMQPWRYFDRIAIFADGDEIADQDVDSRSDWNRSGDGYRLSFTGLDYIVRENDAAELTIVADIARTIDSSDMTQTFTFTVEDRGIRAVDAEGIQQYVGRDSETVDFGFNAEENGDIQIRVNSDNPDPSILVADEDRESGEYEVFVFDLENRDDVDSLITDLTISISDMNGGVSASNVIRRATLEIGRDSYNGDIRDSSIEFEDMDAEIDGDDEVTATLVIRLARNATSTPITFSLASANVDAEGVRSGNSATVSGSVSSETHTIAFDGIVVEAVSTSQATVTPGDDASAAYGTYTIKFDVTGLEDDAYIATTSAATGTVGTLYTIEGNAFAGTESSFLSSTARMENGFYLVREGRTETFTLTVVLDPSTAGTYLVRLDSVRFNSDADFTGSTNFSVANDTAYRTNPVYIPN